MSGLRIAVAMSMVASVGTTLALAEVRSFSRRPLAERLAPFTRGSSSTTGAGVLSVRSMREVLGPLLASAGDAVARASGIRDPLATRLERVHRSETVTAFRLRQLGWAGLGLGVALVVLVAVAPPTPVGLVITVAALLIGYLAPEQSLSAEIARRRRGTVLELPVVVEQMATLLGAGWSLAGAIGRVAERGSGHVARDLSRVRRRIQHGIDEIAALREWAEVADVAAVSRLVPVLALNRDTPDLGRLLAEEARSIRRDVHRDLIETMERRTQQVWIPVTVATLVPGVIFMAVPFLDALRFYSGS